MIRINSTVQRVYRQINFKKKTDGQQKERKSTTNINTHSAAENYKPALTYSAGYQSTKASNGKKNPLLGKLSSEMPADVSLINNIATELSKNIESQTPEIKGDFENADITVIFDKTGNIMHIFNNGTKENYKAQERYARPLYYGELKSSNAKKPSPGAILSDGNIVWLENIRFQNGKPLYANMHSLSGKESFKIHFKDGILHRFEFMEEKDQDENTVQILNFEKGEPRSYIKFECPSTYDAKSFKWLKFYDFNDGAWQATPPDHA